MKTLSKILIAPLFVFAFLLFSCSSDDDEDVQANCGPEYCVADLQGTWNATSVLFTPCVFEGFEGIDIIAEGGTAQMVVQSNGRFTLTVAFPGEGSESFTGQIYFEDGVWFAIQFDEDPPNDPTYFGDTLSGNTFSLNGGPETAEFDFDDDGEDECASVYLRFEKV